MTTTTRQVRFIPLLVGALVFTAGSATQASADSGATPAVHDAAQVRVTAARHDIALNAVSPVQPPATRALN